jgi:hypothetical protein
MDDNTANRYRILYDHLWIRVQRDAKNHLARLVAVEAGFDHLDPNELDQLIENLLR